MEIIEIMGLGFAVAMFGFIVYKTFQIKSERRKQKAEKARKNGKDNSYTGCGPKD